MPDINLYKSYNSRGDSVHDLFDRREEGFFVPLYQREYTWEEDNINQLFDDLVLGIRELSDEDGDNATTFLGTTILTDLIDKKDTVQTGQDKAQPTAVQLVIDGQQRISTIAILSIQIAERFKVLKARLPNNVPYTALLNHCDDLLGTLHKFYAINLGRGATPPDKPKIIRAKEDRWSYDGDDASYGSPVAHYIATYIRTGDPTTAFESIDLAAGARVRGNIKLINEWLDAICNAHVQGTRLHNQFPVASKIATERMQEYILGFKDNDLSTVITKAETVEQREDYFAVSIYHVFLLTYYLMRRCGVNLLQPTHEEWGFDMFQALNTTGTPLTAMETFLPQVMQAEHAAGHDWMKTLSRTYMDEIDELFEETASNEQKNRRTNELLSAFALCYEGEKLGNKFSGQRRWITRHYEKGLPTIEEKRQFLCNLSQVATFFYAGWYMEGADTPQRIKGLEDHPNSEFASFLVQYLKDANSKLSAPILARYFSQIPDGETAAEEFVEAAKACAAFFTLYRTANSTSGLDDIYRRFFRGSSSLIKVDKHSWKAHPKPISAQNLKRYFGDVLNHSGIAKREDWIKASERFLLFTEVKVICRFVLFIAGHDRVPDNKNPGLTVPGKAGVCPLLSISRWTAKDHKSLEHVAPQGPPSSHGWDRTIYSENKVHEIGNLVLLPTDINKFVDNKDWAVKFLHYAHVGGRRKEEIEELSEEAAKRGVVLSKKALKVLSNAKYSCALESILTLGASGLWDSGMIDCRTHQIKEIAWDVLMSWLST